MSLGGAVAGQVCLNDKRCRVGANLDGFQFGDLHHRSIGVPFMMISSDYSRGPLLNDRMYRAPGQPSPVLDLQVAGARHLDFTDFTLSVPLIKRLLPNPAIGSVNGGRMVRLLNALTLGFFDEHLLGKEGAVKAAMRGRPELRVRSVPGSAVQPVPGTQVAP
jgi:predicted dienelactone hydrolase